MTPPFFAAQIGRIGIKASPENCNFWRMGSTIFFFGIYRNQDLIFENAL